jgi:hypothetical protein
MLAEGESFIINYSVKKLAHNHETHMFLCSFSLFAQRKRTKRKGNRSLGPASWNFPAFLEKTGSLKTRFAQTVQTPDSAFSAVLGYVKWSNRNKFKQQKEATTRCDLS